jgi:ribosomal protein S18 acetylase RimI-like enzyme
MKVYILEDKSKSVQINDLLHVLSPHSPEIDEERLDMLLHEKDFRLFAAETAEGIMAGMLTLTRCQTLAMSKYWIEDVIVSPEFRGQGIGRALVEAAINHVKDTDEQSTIYLTSNPSRQAARTLYRSVGFEEYETGVFRMI